jgi:hypothetical protein
MFMREPLPLGATWSLTRRHNPFTADHLPELLQRAGPTQQGGSAVQAIAVSDASLLFPEGRRAPGAGRRAAPARRPAHPIAEARRARKATSNAYAVRLASSATVP